MKLTKIKIQNYRCFGEEQIIDFDDLTAFIGNNCSGKTTAMSALNCIFSNNSNDRILKRSDFHLPHDKSWNSLDHQELFIEAVFVFDELAEKDADLSAIPVFFKSFVVDEPGGTPYLRIRLEASWEKSNNIEGAIENKVYYITCSESEAITESAKSPANRKDLDQIRVIYVPAVRDPSKQLKNTSGTMINQIMSKVNWSDESQKQINDSIEALNQSFLAEKGISVISESINSQWKMYDSDSRYTNAQLRFNSTDINSSIKNSEVVFSPAPMAKECSIDELSDGLRSLFYISLVDSILNVEIQIKQEMPSYPEQLSFSFTPPVLTIIALEEPENHIAPHLIGKLVHNLKSIASKSNAQTILSSHSSSIIKRVEPENLRYFRIDSRHDTTSVRSLTLPDKEKLSDQYKYIKEAVKAYPELYFAKLVILGEGDSEEIILPKVWNAKNGDTDISGISIVPLGGRHVNHFWRLLNDLKIPHITLLDLDRERDGGGWGRIAYAVEQLIQYNPEKKSLLQSDKGTISLDAMKKWNVSDNMDLWIKWLEENDVFFSSPLDIDFLMLEQYKDVYISTLESSEGPQLMVSEEGKKHRNKIIDIETQGKTSLPEYTERIENDVHSTLKECGGDGATYSDEQKRLMIWYTYFFLNRGKPSTHIEALSRIDNEQLKTTMPDVLCRLIASAEKKLKETM